MIKLISRTVDNSVPIESYPAGAGDFERGRALKLSEGKLKLAAGQDSIEFISEETKTCKDGEMLKVTRVVADGIYESELEVDVESINPGGRFGTTGYSINLPDEDGPVRILYTEGKSAGSKVRFNII